jgi:hypothetical protein
VEQFPAAAKQLQVHCGRCAKTILRFVPSDKNRFFSTPKGRIQRGARNILSQVAKLRQNSGPEKKPTAQSKKHFDLGELSTTSELADDGRGDKWSGLKAGKPCPANHEGP